MSQRSKAWTIINRDAQSGQTEINEEATEQDISLLRSLFCEFGHSGEVIHPDNSREEIGTSRDSDVRERWGEILG